MPGEVHKTCLGGLRHELLVGRVGLFLVLDDRDERHVHDRAVLLRGGRLEERAPVEEVVEDLRFLAVRLGHRLEPAGRLDVLEDETHHVHRVAWRGVEHRALVGVGVIAEHRRYVGGKVPVRLVFGPADQVLADDHDGHSRGGEVLLRAGVDDAELRDVHRLGEDVGGRVAHERDIPGLGERGHLGAEDRVVRGDVDVVVISLDLRDLGDVGVVLVLGGGDDVDGHPALRFLERLAGPDAGVDVRGFALLLEVERHHRELEARAALEEENLVVRRDIHELAEEGLGFRDDRLKRLGAMAHLHNGLARPVAVEHLGGGALENFLGQHRGTCGEIVHSVHFSLLSFESVA